MGCTTNKQVFTVLSAGVTVTVHRRAPRWLRSASQWAAAVDPQAPAVCLIHRAPTPVDSSFTSSFVLLDALRPLLPPGLPVSEHAAIGWYEPCGDALHLLDPDALCDLPWFPYPYLLGVCGECRRRHGYFECGSCMTPTSQTASGGSRWLCPLCRITWAQPPPNAPGPKRPA